jgi:2-polyprenyl-3-methyl-5-hydroxy-6-metoxy-1,4-benzoquinol methylase
MMPQLVNDHSAARWNHNIHYHRVITAALPARCARVLDVGCGEGVLAAEIAPRAGLVVGLDQDAASIGTARREVEAPNVDFVIGDFLAHPFRPESFDAIVSVAVLHHVDSAAALSRMRELLRPGGVVALVGLARTRRPVDLGFDVAGAIAHRFYRLSRGYWESSAPTVWPPAESYQQARRTAEAILPVVRYQRHVLWRYSLVWRKP